MGFLSFLDAFRSRPRAKEIVQLEPPRRERSIFQESSNRRDGGPVSKASISAPVTKPSNNASRRKSMSRRRSWFGGRPDADEAVPAMPTLVPNDYNSAADIKTPNLGRASKSRGSEYAQLPSDKRERRTSTYRQNVTAIGALPGLPAMPTTVYHTTQPATSTLPDEQRRSRRQSMSSKSLHRSSSRASTKSKRRSFWASSNPADDDEEAIPPVPALVRDGTPDSVRNDPMEDLARVPSRGRPRSSTNSSGPKPARPVSSASRKSYVPRAAASGFLKSTNGASEDQRKSYRRSFKLGEGVELVCVTDEHRVEWEKLMNKNARLDDSLFASMGRDSDESNDGARFSNAQALAALEFGTVRN